MNLIGAFTDSGERLKKHAENQSKSANIAKLIVDHHIDKPSKYVNI